MIKFFQVHKLEIIIIIFLTGLYFLLRVPNLTLQPIFADEAIYIRWAQIMKAEPTLRFLPLSDGKTPLFMWAMAPFFKIFSDPLLAGRFLSVLSGYATFVGVLFLGWKNFGSRVGLWSAFLLSITPFMVFFDRMALVDTMLAAFSVWSLNFALLLIKYQRIDLAMCLGYLLGGGLLTKTPGMFNVLVLPVSALAINWKTLNRQKTILKIFGLWLITLTITFGIYNALRLGPGFINLSSRNQDYIFSPMDLVGRPLDPFLPHFNDLKDWFPKLLTLPVLLLILSGAALSLYRKDKVAITILLWAILPMVVEMFLLKTFTARYILFSIPPLICLGGYILDQLVKKIKVPSLIITSLIAILPVLTVWQLLTRPDQVNLPRSERSGYFEAWTAGYGFPEIAQFLISEAKKGTIIVGTEGTFGTLPDGLQIYLDQYFHLSPKGQEIVIMPDQATVSARLRKEALKYPTYFVSNKSRFWGGDNLQLIKEFPKAVAPGGDQDKILLFKVLPE